MNGYYVQLLDGPAEGWAYFTLVPPLKVIGVAPVPRVGVAPVPRVGGGWFRVPEGGQPWPGECRYERQDLPRFGEPIPDDRLTSDDEILVKLPGAEMTLSPPHLNDVAELLKAAGLTITEHGPLNPAVAHLFAAADHPLPDGSQSIDVACELAEIEIAARPLNCDRGRFIVYVLSNDPAVLTIDWADGFPRYYFGAEACASELLAWMAARGLLPEGVQAL